MARTDYWSGCRRGRVKMRCEEGRRDDEEVKWRQRRKECACALAVGRWNGGIGGMLARWQRQIKISEFVRYAAGTTAWRLSRLHARLPSHQIFASHCSPTFFDAWASVAPRHRRRWPVHQVEQGFATLFSLTIPHVTVTPLSVPVSINSGTATRGPTCSHHVTPPYRFLTFQMSKSA